MTKIIVFYHGNCVDGFTAAWVLKKYFLGNENIDFIPMSYGDVESPDDLKRYSIKGKDIFLLDFSFPKEVIIELTKVANNVIILDHHQTAQEYIEPMIDEGLIKGRFDMNESGASLTWNWFFDPVVERPELIDYVKDRDLWRFELPYSKSISQYVFSFEYSFDNWDEIAKEIEYNFDSCVKQGEAIERKHMKDIEELLKVTAIQNVTFDKWGCDKYIVANLPYIHASDAGHLMAKSYQDEFQKPVGVTYFQNSNGQYVFSLRSIGEFDVSELAKKYGGGGHKNAAGFVVDEIPFTRN